MLAPCVNALQSTGKVSKTFTILKGFASVSLRHERVHGVGHNKKIETLLIVSQSQISLPPVNGGATGPVVTTHGKPLGRRAGGIDVGGKLDVGAPEPERGSSTLA